LLRALLRELAQGQEQVQPRLSQTVLGDGGQDLGVARRLLGLDHLDVAGGCGLVGDPADPQGTLTASSSSRVASRSAIRARFVGRKVPSKIGSWS
jgi:hypothetical protein